MNKLGGFMAAKKKLSQKNMKLGLLSNRDFVDIFNKLYESALPVKASYLLLIIKDEIKKHSEYYELMRQKLIIKHGETNEDGTIKMNEEKTQFLMKDLEAFNVDFKALGEIEVPITKIPISELGNCQFTPIQLSILLSSIVEDS